MNTKNAILGMTIVAVLLIAAVGSASAIDITECTVITAPGTYVITADITNSTATYCIDIQSDDVIIDGHGHFIDGVDNDAWGAGIHYFKRNAVGDNVTIKNVEIKRFDNGIWFEGIGTAKFNNITIENCSIHDNGNSTDFTGGQGIHLLHVCNSTIKHNEVYNQTGLGSGCEAGGNGIFLKGSGANYGWARNNTIFNNTCYNNRKGGIFMKASPEFNEIINNTVTGNGDPNAGEAGGIILRCKQCRNNLIAYNNASDNRGGGIFIGGPNNTVRDNNVNDNDWYGICLGRDDGSYYNIIEHNTICGNKGTQPRQRSGIHIVEGAHDNELYNNTICDNVYNDIENYEPSTSGDWNTCDTCCGDAPYSDTSATECCLYKCPGTGPDLVVIDLHETWVVVGSSYNVTFTVKNIGGENATSESNTSVRIVNNTGVVVHNQKYQTPALNATQYPGNSSTWEIGPFDFTNAAAPHTITVCADIDNDVDEYGAGDEENNCSEDVFGAPDLVISYFMWDSDGEVEPYGNADGLVDESWKRYWLVYRVKNVGDVNVTTPFWMNVSCLKQSTEEPEYSCVDTDPVTRLNVSEETPNRVVGPFVIGCDKNYPNIDWVQVCADYNDTITENYEHVPGEVQPQWDRIMPSYTGCCDECGDVTGEGTVSWSDGSAVVAGNIATCKWAADVDCSYSVSWSDGSAIVSGSLNCCEPGCPAP